MNDAIYQIVIGILILNQYNASAAHYPIAIDKNLLVSVPLTVLNKKDIAILETNGWKWENDPDVHGDRCWVYYTGH